MKHVNLTLFMLMTSVILFFTLTALAANVSPMVLGNVEVSGLAMTIPTEVNGSVLANDAMLNSDVNLAGLGGTAATCVDAMDFPSNLSANNFCATIISQPNEIEQNQIESKYSLGTTWANKMENMPFSQMTESAVISSQESNPFNAIAMSNPFNDRSGTMVAGRTHQRV